MRSVPAPTRSSLTAADLAGGVIVSTLSPFDEDGMLLVDSISDQVRRISSIDSIKGLAVHSTLRERRTMTSEERIEVVRRTRAGMEGNQILLACVGTLTETTMEDVWAYQQAGASAAVTFPSCDHSEIEDCTLDQEAERIAELADRLPLPVIVALGAGRSRRSARSKVIKALVTDVQNVIGFDLGADDSVLNYDQDYYALKSFDRPLACLPSSEAALFHNLNTGADGVLSCLAFIAPHEVTALYKATREYRFCDAQAFHNRLSPLIGLLAGHDQHTREMIYREAAYQRHLLPSSDARGLSHPLAQDLKIAVSTTLEEIRLKPVANQ